MRFRCTDVVKANVALALLNQIHIVHLWFGSLCSSSIWLLVASLDVILPNSFSPSLSAVSGISTGVVSAGSSSYMHQPFQLACAIAPVPEQAMPISIDSGSVSISNPMLLAQGLCQAPADVTRLTLGSHFPKPVHLPS